MGNTLAKSPQELTLATARSIEKQRQLILEPVSPPPPPGYVRVHFHSHLYQIYDRSLPDLTADVPLCRSGGLDLDVVKRRWGLETCLPVDPLRWKPFEPSHPNYLSPVAIEVLSYGQGCVKFIEPTVSRQTLMQRQTREAVLGITSLVQLSCFRSFQMFAECIEADTPLPDVYRHFRRQAQRIRFAWKWEEILSVFIMCIWIGLAVASFGGYIQWAPKERARMWVHTGSFLL
ncbi:hypothetical protein DFH08DRAFT_1072390 [Mycena albidolilacea]|uniref:Uncharacterized protein n=1 Tax=Mycena albidolilacea TaxID=1033008 RepID=A0AAD7AS92_9AGAR|nr:hypothetical protein DFH08DRAFT_1072390 [Mycena albidolilacea]